MIKNPVINFLIFAIGIILLFPVALYLSFEIHRYGYAIIVSFVGWIMAMYGVIAIVLTPYENI